MFFQASGNRQDVWIKNNIIRWEARLLGQQVVRTPADVDFALEIVRLASLIECHDDGRGAILSDQPRLSEKFIFAVFQAD